MLKKAMPIAMSMVFLAGLATVLLWTHSPAPALAHCQMPCGIYDDAARIKQLREDAATIDKAIHNIAELSGKTDATSMNQLIRWVTTKEEHASHIITTVSEYFLAQRVKAAGGADLEKYHQSLADHHAVIVAAMKCKQVPEKASVDALNAAINKIAVYYPGS